MRTLRTLLAILAVFAAPALMAGGKKPLPVTIRLHGEGQAKDGSSFVAEVAVTALNKKIYITKVPVISERDIKAFLPFPAADGSVGAYFQVDYHGADKLSQFSLENRGKIAVVTVNGRVAAAMRVEPVNDRILYVPSGILPMEIVQLGKKYPVIGRESEFGKKQTPPKAEKVPVNKPAPQPVPAP